MWLTSSTRSSVRSRCTRPGRCSLRELLCKIRYSKTYVCSLLYSSGIQPSNKTTYSLTQLQSALKAQTGSVPFLGCGHNGTVLQEVWYFHHVLGTVSLNLHPA